MPTKFEGDEVGGGGGQKKEWGKIPKILIKKKKQGEGVGYSAFSSVPGGGFGSKQISGEYLKISIHKISQV